MYSRGTRPLQRGSWSSARPSSTTDAYRGSHSSQWFRYCSSPRPSSTMDKSKHPSRHLLIPVHPSAGCHSTLCLYLVASLLPVLSTCELCKISLVESLLFRLNNGAGTGTGHQLFGCSWLPLLHVVFSRRTFFSLSTREVAQ